MKNSITKSLNNAISYIEYRALIKKLLINNKVTGNVQTEDLVAYSKLNDKRMDRLDKKLVVTEKNKTFLAAIPQNITFIVLAEGWCGDAAQIVPMIAKIAEASPKITLKIVLRDENEALMNLFLTNGGKAIPKLILIDDTTSVIGQWGPRPATATAMVKEYKEKHGVIDSEFKKNLQLWYNKDKGVSTQNDIIKILNHALEKSHSKA